jgi:hypothetical protein
MSSKDKLDKIRNYIKLAKLAKPEGLTDAEKLQKSDALLAAQIAAVTILNNDQEIIKMAGFSDELNPFLQRLTGSGFKEEDNDDMNDADAWIEQFDANNATSLGIEHTESKNSNSLMDHVTKKEKENEISIQRVDYADGSIYKIHGGKFDDLKDAIDHVAKDMNCIVTADKKNNIIHVEPKGGVTIDRDAFMEKVREHMNNPKSYHGKYAGKIVMKEPDTTHKAELLPKGHADAKHAKPEAEKAKQQDESEKKAEKNSFGVAEANKPTPSRSV